MRVAIDMGDDDLDALPWAADLPESDRARVREELEEWRATAEAYRDGHGAALSVPVDVPVGDDDECVDRLRESLIAGEESGPAAPVDFDQFIAAKVEESRAAGPGRTGRPERTEHMDAARDEGTGPAMTDEEDATRALSTLDEVREAAMQLDIDERADVLVALLDTLGEEHQDLLRRAAESETVRRAYRRRGQEPDA